MTGYEKELLALAVGACECLTWVRTESGGWRISGGEVMGALAHVDGPTLADALTALLHDLGEEVPERPSAEWVGGAAMAMVETYINAIEAQDKGVWTAEAPIEAIFSYLRNLYAREPLTVLALLEGSES